jgi:hypothetical protein
MPGRHGEQHRSNQRSKSLDDSFGSEAAESKIEVFTPNDHDSGKDAKLDRLPHLE